MKCPICEVDLVMTDRQGVEIDYCPKCRGVWLDRGELDKIIERSSPVVPTRGRTEGSKPDRDSDKHHGDKHYEAGRREKKRGSFLGELFDFG
jgi:hypothetical protein